MNARRLLCKARGGHVFVATEPPKDGKLKLVCRVCGEKGHMEILKARKI